MSYFTETEKSFGSVKERQTRYIVFKGTHDIPKISKLSAGCGCAKPTYNVDSNELTVKFSSGVVPKQVAGIQSIRVPIVVIYADKSREILYIYGTKSR